MGLPGFEPGSEAFFKEKSFFLPKAPMLPDYTITPYLNLKVLNP